MNEDQIHRIGFILDETDGQWETKMFRQAAADHRVALFDDLVCAQSRQTFFAERFDLIHMYMNFPFFD